MEDKQVQQRTAGCAIHLAPQRCNNTNDMWQLRPTMLGICALDVDHIHQMYGSLPKNCVGILLHNLFYTDKPPVDSYLESLKLLV